MDCAIIGDSIAVGISRASPRECYENVMGGRPSWLQRELPADLPARLVIISLGANDSLAQRGRTLGELLRIRNSLPPSACPVWIIPNTANASIIRQWALAQGDLIIETAPVVGPDRIHASPAGYRRLWTEAAGLCPQSAQ